MTWLGRLLLAVTCLLLAGPASAQGRAAGAPETATEAERPGGTCITKQSTPTRGIGQLVTIARPCWRASRAAIRCRAAWPALSP